MILIVNTVKAPIRKIVKKLKSQHQSSMPRKMEIIQAALRCFTEKGFTDTSISDVCGLSGASVGSIYHHFKSKEQLAAAVYLEGIRSYQAGLIEVIQDRADAKEGVTAIVRYHLGWIEKNGDWARFLTRYRHAEFMGSTEDEFTRLNTVFNSTVGGWFLKHIKSGAIRKIPPDLYFCIILGPCQEYARIYLSGENHSTPATAIEEIAAAAWRAVSA